MHPTGRDDLRSQNTVDLACALRHIAKTATPHFQGCQVDVI